MVTREELEGGEGMCVEDSGPRGRDWRDCVIVGVKVMGVCKWRQGMRM